MIRPLVSVRLMTYNQEAFVRKTLESIMSQKTEFCFEVVVGDDFSSDQTLQILSSFQDTEKIKIRILQRERGDEYDKKRQENGRIYNFVDILKHCNGRYIAPIDGDDFWTSDTKLQRAVDVLEANESVSVVFTNSERCSEDGAFTGRYLTDSKFSMRSDIKSLLRSNTATSGTVVYRQFDPAVLEPWIYDMNMGDWPVNLVALGDGDLFYLNDVSSAYRVHAGGVWSSSSELSRRYQVLRSYRIMLDNGLFDSCYKDALEEYLRQLIKLHGKVGMNLKCKIRKEAKAVYSSCLISSTKRLKAKAKLMGQRCKPSANKFSESIGDRWPETVISVNEKLLNLK